MRNSVEGRILYAEGEAAAAGSGEGAGAAQGEGQGTGGSSVLSGQEQGGASGGGSQPSTRGQAQSTEPNTADGEQPDLSLNSFANSLPSDVANDNDLMSLGTVPDALRAYKQAKQAMTMDPKRTVELPADTGDLSELNQFAQKLGLPASPEDMSIEQPKDSQGNPIEGFETDNPLAQEFTKKAHEVGVLPQQAQALYDWFASHIQGVQQEQAQQQTSQINEAKEALQKEWGEAFEQKLSQARIAVEQLGGQDLMQALENTGAANDPNVLKALAKVGPLVAEDPGVTGAAPAGGGAQTPAALRSEADRLEREAINANNSRDQKQMLEKARGLRERANKF